MKNYFILLCLTGIIGAGAPLYGFSLFSSPEQKVVDTLQKRSRKKINLYEKLQKAWTDHIVWDDRFISAVVYNTGQEDAIADRLMHNAQELANIFKPYVPTKIFGQLQELFKEHVQLAGNTTKAAVHQASGFAELNKRWHDNMQQITQVLAGAIKKLNSSKLLKYLTAHLDGANKVTNYRMHKQYTQDVTQTDNNLQTATDIAATLSLGLIQQFGRKFK